jgi:hypothetical protein
MSYEIETITFVNNKDQSIRANVYGYTEDDGGWVDEGIDFENFTQELHEKFDEIYEEEGGNQDTLYEMGFYDI